MVETGSRSRSFGQWVVALLTAFLGAPAAPTRAAEEEPQAHPMRGAGEFGAEGLPTGEMHQPTEAEQKARGRRNVAIALAVTGFVLLVYLTTFFRLAQNLSAGSAS